MPADLANTIKTILEEGIKTSTIDERAKDSFTASLLAKENGFGINIIGALFSRINADLATKSVSVG